MVLYVWLCYRWNTFEKLLLMATIISEACEKAIKELWSFGRLHILFLFVCNTWWPRFGLKDLGLITEGERDIFVFVWKLKPTRRPMRFPIQRIRGSILVVQLPEPEPNHHFHLILTFAISGIVLACGMYRDNCTFLYYTYSCDLLLFR